MGKKRILVVDDELEFLLMMDKFLGRKGYEVLTANGGEAGLAIAAARNPDLVLLDIRMPSMNGLEVCQKPRKIDPGIRIIFLTALAEDMDKVRGLDIGGDDYITKPFKMVELEARIRALLRKSVSHPTEPIAEFGKVNLNLNGREVSRGGDSVDLTAKEFDLLAYFLSHSNEVLSRNFLLNEVWGPGNTPTDRTIDTHVAHLRKKLEEDPKNPLHFLTVHGVGYKFIP